MKFLLDTNVVSEWAKPHPDPGVARWFSNVDEDCAFISVITIAELRHGVERMSLGIRRSRLDAWLAEEVPARFDDRVLSVDLATADAWGCMVARCQAIGRPMAAMDALIGATAERHGLTLVTRNLMDFHAAGIPLLNPFGQAGA